MHTHEFCIQLRLYLYLILRLGSDPRLLGLETWTKILLKSEQDEDGSLSLCSQVLLTHVAAGTVADTQATPVVESV